MSETEKKEIKTAGKGRKLKGKVVSAKMTDTVVVSVTRFVKHPKYDKFVKKEKRYKAHDKGNTKKEGEMVEILEVKPISKDKHFKIVG